MKQQFCAAKTGEISHFSGNGKGYFRFNLTPKEVKKLKLNFLLCNDLPSICLAVE
jgi:hypothetical protein